MQRTANTQRRWLPRAAKNPADFNLRPPPNWASKRLANQPAEKAGLNPTNTGVFEQPAFVKHRSPTIHVVNIEDMTFGALFHIPYSTSEPRTIDTHIMKTFFALPSGIAAVALVLGAMQAPGQSVLLDFQDGTDQGFGTGFGNDASANFSIVNIGGSLRMFVPIGGFQVAGDGHGNDGSAFYNAMAAAAANPAGYNISYDYYIDTSAFTGAGFLQIGTFVNSGSGYYAQDFGAVKEVELNGTQLASGQVFSGTVTLNMAAVGFNMPPADTFFRLGFIENGNGTGTGVYFDNISVAPVPEPSTLALAGLGAMAFLRVFRRRHV